MKKLIVTAIVAAAMTLVPISSASAATFHSCAQVRQTYPGGIAKVGTKGNRNQYTHRMMAFEHKPKFSNALYAKYSFLDADNDHVACEG